MADNIERQLLSKLIKANNYITSKELASSLDVSEKTILKYLNGLRSDLERNGASLEIKHGYGSMLKVDNQEKFNKYLAQNGTNRIPSTKEERKVYILSRLLNTEDYINVYDADKVPAGERVEGEFFLRGVKLTLAGQSVQPDAALVADTNVGEVWDGAPVAG